MKSKLSSLVLTPPLFLVAIAYFFWGNNAHMYPPKSLTGSALALFIAAGIAVLIGFALRFFWEKFALEKYWMARLLLGGGIAGITLYCINIFLRIPLHSMLPTNLERLLFRGAIVLVFCSLSLFRLRSATKFLNVFFMASICMSAYMAASVFLEDDQENADTTGEAVSVALKKTPNIYLFWMDSFPEPRIIDEYYGSTLVRDGFPGELEKRGFRLLGNTYSNSSSTLLSMADLFSMQLSTNRAAGEEDVTGSVRRMLGGSDQNQILKILKNNGYFTAFISGENSYYHGGEVGRYLDSTDYVVSNNSLRFYLRPLLELNSHSVERRFGRYLFGADQRMHDEYSGDLRNRVRQAMDLAKSNGKPLFVSFKGGAKHTMYPYTWLQQEEWLPVYRNLVKDGISQAMGIIDMILADDPEAVIILLGDHGSWRLLGIFDDIDINDTKALAAQLRKYNESLQSLVDDYFNVIFAVRMPGYEGDFSHGYAISTVNVFRHVFAALNNDPALLENRQPNISRLSKERHRKVQFVIEGKIISE